MKQRQKNGGKRIQNHSPATHSFALSSRFVFSEMSDGGSSLSSSPPRRNRSGQKNGDKRMGTKESDSPAPPFPHTPSRTGGRNAGVAALAAFWRIMQFVATCVREFDRRDGDGKAHPSSNQGKGMEGKGIQNHSSALHSFALSSRFVFSDMSDGGSSLSSSPPRPK
jgi:hypothetical protein